MTQFDLLFEAVNLAKAGYKNAAKQKWDSLTQEFKLVILQFTLSCKRTPERLGKVEVVLKSRFGMLLLSDDTVSSLATYVPTFLS